METTTHLAVDETVWVFAWIIFFEFFFANRAMKVAYPHLPKKGGGASCFSLIAEGVVGGWVGGGNRARRCVRHGVSTLLSATPWFKSTCRKTLSVLSPFTSFSPPTHPPTRPQAHPLHLLSSSSSSSSSSSVPTSFRRTGRWSRGRGRGWVGGGWGVVVDVIISTRPGFLSLSRPCSCRMWRSLFLSLSLSFFCLFLWFFLLRKRVRVYWCKWTGPATRKERKKERKMEKKRRESHLALARF